MTWYGISLGTICGASVYLLCSAQRMRDSIVNDTTISVVIEELFSIQAIYIRIKFPFHDLNEVGILISQIQQAIGLSEPLSHTNHNPLDCSAHLSNAFPRSILQFQNPSFFLGDLDLTEQLLRVVPSFAKPAKQSDHPLSAPQPITAKATAPRTRFSNYCGMSSQDPRLSRRQNCKITSHSRKGWESRQLFL